MTFNPNAKIDSGKVSKRGRTAAIGGGSVVVVVGLLLLSQLLGVDLTGLAGGSQGSDSAQDSAISCETGADANASVDCLITGAATSLDVYWTTHAADVAAQYRSPGDVILFDQSTTTGCGQATSAVGPFYCPPDEQIYLDTEFFDELRTRFGASGGTLSQMYVIAHEWGHHIQNLTGVLASENSSDTGPASDSVRTELQADCYAGAWVGAASTIADENGTTFLEPVTSQQIADALNAASVIGDDRIQQQSGGQVNPEAWTHGSSQSRQTWFETGLSGGPASCDTFAVGADRL
ncbi:KPN_02809 family neutral zinc metallopeptidase [Herbiconiux sp. P18]|uniref:KPN_02809 family neutral zinc metallopeptidase n=1 Tax=Herbiconiux liangxiaofengii TaxID=3342795 RepID=UPI0035B6C8A1